MLKSIFVGVLLYSMLIMRFCITFFFLSFFICCNNKTQKIVLWDTQGNSVELNEPAQRIVCLFNASMDLVYMLQAQDKLVGIPAEVYFDNNLFDYYKQIDKRISNKELPTTGNNELLNLESIVRLNPDLVIAGQLPENICQSLKQQGIGVYLSSSDGYKGLIKETRDLATLIGAKERAERLITYVEDRIRIFNQEWEVSTDGKSVYFSSNDNRFSNIEYNVINDCLEIAGVENVDRQSVDNFGSNDVLKNNNPYMIVTWNDNPHLYYNKTDLASLDAIKHRRVFDLTPTFFYNPQTFKSLCAAVAIHHWAYPDDFVSIEDEVKDLIVTLYGKEYGDRLMDVFYVSQ